MYFENDIHIDYDIKWLIFTTLYVAHVYRPVFEGGFEYHRYTSVEGHLERQHTHGITYILKTYMCQNKPLSCVVHEYVALEVQIGP